MSVRGRVVLIENGEVALIRRVRAGQTYHVFPGGGAEKGETPEQAAVREVREEMGVVVELDRLVAVIEFGESVQHYYLAHTVGGEFGAGAGPEYSGPDGLYEGAHEPVWVSIDDLIGLDVRPLELVEMITKLRAS